VARPLTPDELTRYPWATQISDYVPVGRLRAIGVLVGIAGLIVLLLGALVSVAAAQNVHHAVAMDHLPTKLGVYLGVALTVVAALIGIVTLVQCLLKRGSLALMCWSVVAIVPAIIMFLVIRPMVH
jgi:hypothetical protein